MENKFTLKAGDNSGFIKIPVTAQFMTVLEADHGLELRVAGQSVGFNVDIADEIDFGFQNEFGFDLFVRNHSELQNDVVLEFAPVFVRRKKNVELTADLSSIEVADGEIRINPVQNAVTVDNFPVGFDVDNFPLGFNVNNFPLGFNVNNFPLSFEVSNQLDKKFTISHATHILTQAEIDAGGWAYNNGGAEKIIVSASINVKIGNTDIAAGQKITLDKLAPNQDFIFTGAAGDEIDLIIWTVV